MASPVEEFSPSYMGEERISLETNATQERVAAFESVLIDVSYDDALPEGVMCPLVLEIQGPSPTSYVRREYLRRPPNFVIFVPQEGGPHLVILRELAHNRWQGRLHLDVEGETVEQRKSY